MFFGNYQGTLDEKGRIHIPSALSKQIKGSNLVITQWGEALAAFPKEEFVRLADRLEEEARVSKDPSKRMSARSIFSNSFEEALKNGKLLIPQELRKVINGDKKLRIVGIKDKIEIWSEARWIELEKPVDGKTMREELDGFGLL